MLELSIQQIRQLSGPLADNFFYTTDVGKTGIWSYAPNDVTSTDNTGTVLRTSDGKVIKRNFDSAVNILWFGAINDGAFDNTILIKYVLSLFPSVYIPDGYYLVSEELNLSNAIGTGVVINNITWERIVYSQLAKKNQFSKPFGSSFSSGSGGKTEVALTISRLTGMATAMNLIPYRPFLNIVHFYKEDATGDYKILQFDLTSLGYSEAHHDAAMQIMHQKGGRMIGLKVHGYSLGNVGDITTDAAKYFADYKSNIQRLCAKYQGQFDYFFAFNESDIITSNPSYSSYILEILQTINAAGFKTGLAFQGTNEADNCLYNNAVDVLGFNLYPSVGVKAVRTSIEESIAAWENDLSKIDGYKTLYPEKEIFVTEFACQDYDTALETPPAYNYPGEGLNDGEIQAIFYEGAFRAIDRNKNISYCFAWDQGESFGPWYTGVQAKELIKRIFI